jgi:ABC-2 type transport system permease protein
MKNMVDLRNIWTLALRTFRQSVESPMAYIVAFFFYGFLGGLYGTQFITSNNGSVEGLSMIAPWALWIVIPALTMGLISEELRSGTFEHLSTLPLRDWEIVLGKYIGACLLIACLIGGLFFYPMVASFLVNHPLGIDWGASVGIIAGLFFMSLFYAAVGLFASSLVKNQVVALIVGMIFCTILFFIGQFAHLVPLSLTGAAEWLGVNSHLETLGRGVWDVRDLLYFVSMTGFFLYLASLRLSARRF